MRWSILVVIGIALACLAMQIQPQEIDFSSSPGFEVNEIFTLTNDDAQPRTLTIESTEFSEYLISDFTWSPKTFTLLPGESENIQLTGVVPILGPETHILKLDVTEKGILLGSFSAFIPISGNSILRPQIDVMVEEVSYGDPVIGELRFLNFGNVIAYYELSYYATSQGKTVASSSYPQAIQVLPGEEKDLVVLLSDPLDPGEYVFKVDAQVNGVEAVESSSPFRVIIGNTEEKIHVGDDLLVHVKSYGSTPQITYIVRQQDSILLSETLKTDESVITIPTATLAQGNYDVELTIASGGKQDTTHLALSIAQPGTLPSIPAVVVLLLSGVIFFFSKKIFVRVRILVLTIRVAKLEKELNGLLARAHSL